VSEPISIVAALVRDEAGRVLLVRKRGTTVFMQPGGKRDAGEDDVTALARELDEELGCRLMRDAASRLGVFDAGVVMASIWMDLRDGLRAEGR
jgi:8-oxo-dGTP diphosphatase